MINKCFKRKVCLLYLITLCITTMSSAQIRTGIPKFNPKKVPNYLKDYAHIYKKDPHLAAMHWFTDAKYGLFMHYGVYSQVGKAEWVMFKQKMQIKDYTKLMDSFDPSGFDADVITDVAIKGGMKYVCITTKHHDSFALWDSQETEFKATNAPAGRDLIKELAIQCNKKGLGFFLYYSYGRDWRHPHSVHKDLKGERIPSARPSYKIPETSWYASEEEYDLSKYVDYVNKQVTELLTNYGPIAAIWFDAPPEAEVHFDTFKPYKTYQMIHDLQPQCLVTAKWGIKDPSGKHSYAEDYYGPELNQYHPRMQDGGKPIEVCLTFNGSWGWSGSYKNRGIPFLKNAMRASNYLNSNLLLNIAPLPNGSIHPEDIKGLSEVGTWLKENGWPKERIHPKDADVHWKQTKIAYPDKGPYRPLELDFKKKGYKQQTFKD